MPNPRDIFRESYSKIDPATALEQLKRTMNIAPEGTEVVPDWPKVNTPPAFRPYPEVIGGPELQTAVKDALEIAPELQGQFKRIGYPPNKGVFDEMTRSGISPYNYANTTLMGQTNRYGGPNREVYINPQLGSPDEFTFKNEPMGKNIFGGDSWLHTVNDEYNADLPSTVIHELTHIAGKGEMGAQEAEAAWERAKTPQLEGLAQAFSKRVPQ